MLSLKSVGLSEMLDYVIPCSKASPFSFTVEESLSTRLRRCVYRVIWDDLTEALTI